MKIKNRLEFNLLKTMLQSATKSDSQAEASPILFTLTEEKKRRALGSF
jgi:hypothetical protein